MLQPSFQQLPAAYSRDVPKRPIQSRTWKNRTKAESEYFDFATTAQVAFDVNYGKIAGGALIEVFTEDPITYQTNNLYSINGEAVLKSLQMQTDASPAT